MIKYNKLGYTDATVALTDILYLQAVSAKIMLIAVTPSESTQRMSPNKLVRIDSKYTKYLQYNVQ